MKTILVQAHELAIAHGISKEEAIAMLETLDGDDIWLIYHDCQDDPPVATTKDKEKWVQDSIVEWDVECPECGQYFGINAITFEKAKLFPCEHSSYSQYLKNRDRIASNPSLDGDRIIFEWEVPEDYPRDKSRCDDVAEVYRVTENKKAASGIMIWAKYRGEWSCNPTSVRPLVKHLLERMEAAIASQQN